MNEKMKNRNTLQRRMVLNMVTSMKNHPTAEQVFHRISEENNMVSRATVYRNLKLLADEGKIQRVVVPDGADRFDFNITPHYHMECRKCQRVFDVTMPIQTDILEKVQVPQGFEIDSYELVFQGCCKECREAAQA